jgi:ribosomal protein L22
MSEETPEVEKAENEPKPKRRARRKKAVSDTEAASSSEAAVTEVEGQSGSEGPRAGSEEEPASSGGEPEAPVGPSADVEPQAEEEPAEGEERAPEADEETAAEEPAASAEAKAPARRRRRREAEPTQPTPAPRRRRRAEPRRDVVVRAQAKYVRTSARKARLVCDHIRGKTVDEARAILTHAPRAVARDWSKVLESAVANAEHNHELIAEDLYIKAVHADEGPTIKRYRPRALGRATRIRKRTSHLTILLTPKP